MALPTEARRSQETATAKSVFASKGANARARARPWPRHMPRRSPRPWQMTRARASEGGEAHRKGAPEACPETGRKRVAEANHRQKFAAAPRGAAKIAHYPSLIEMLGFRSRFGSRLRLQTPR